MDRKHLPDAQPTSLTHSSGSDASTTICAHRLLTVVTCFVVVVVCMLSTTLPTVEGGTGITSLEENRLDSAVANGNDYPRWEVKRSASGKHHRRGKRTKVSKNHFCAGDCYERIKPSLRSRSHSRSDAKVTSSGNDAYDSMRRDDVTEGLRVSDVSSKLQRDGVTTETGKSIPSWKRLPTAAELNHFKKLVKKTMSCRQLPNLSLALVKQGQVLMTSNLGHADPEAHVPTSRSTRFAVGSLTKAFTATVITEVLLRRNISLDTPISQLLPTDFRLMDDSRTRSVTLLDLLGHRTGIPGYFHALLVGLPTHVTRRQLLRRMQYLPAVVPLRSQFLYNNYLYTLAAHVAESLTGRSWEALVQDLILGPLDMADSGFVDQRDHFNDFALPCAMLNGTLRNLTPELLFSVAPCGPAGSIYSTADDMARWLQVLLGNGKTPDGRQVLQESALRETTRPLMPPPGIGDDLMKPQYPISDVEQSYGLGWITSSYRGYRKVWHSGSIVTYSSRLWLLPGVDAGLFVATSGPQTKQKGQGLYAITSMAADLLLGETLWLNASTICTFPSPWADDDNDDDSSTSYADDNTSRDVSVGKSTQTERIRGLNSIDSLLGVYVHEAFGEIIVERAGSEATGSYVKGENSTSFPAGNASASTVRLTLKFGRFGELRLKSSSAGSYSWEGRFVGPLWYVTGSDQSQKPVRVEFLRDETGRVDRLRYPIDSKYDVIEFHKRFHDVIAPGSYAASGSGVEDGVALLTVAALLVFQLIVI